MHVRSAFSSARERVVQVHAGDHGVDGSWKDDEVMTGRWNLGGRFSGRGPIRRSDCNFALLQ